MLGQQHTQSHTYLTFLIRKLCDDGCTAELKVQEVTIKQKSKLIIHSPIDRSNGLWKIPLTAQLK